MMKSERELFERLKELEELQKQEYEKYEHLSETEMFPRTIEQRWAEIKALKWVLDTH